MKTKTLLAVLILATAMSGVFVSCDDDGDGIGSGKVSNKSFYDIDGQRVKSVGSEYRFSYDEKGNLESYYCDGEYCNVSNNPLKIKNDYSDSFYTVSTTAEISLNSSGYISSIKEKSRWESEKSDEYEIEENAISFSYNGNGQILSMTASGSWIEFYDDEKETGTSTGNASFTYSGPLLTKIVIKYTIKENGETWTGSDTYTFVYDTEYENTFRMYTPEYADVIFESIFEGLAFIGMFGNASSMLPDYIEHKEYEKESDGEEYEDYDTHNCYYSFKANGAIKSADGYDYTYTTVETRAEEVTIPMEETRSKHTQKNCVMSKIMRHHMHKK